METKPPQVQAKIHTFSTPIFQIKFPNSEDLNRDLIDVILNREKTEISRPRSRRGGWQSASDANLWPQPPFKKLCDLAVGAASSVLTQTYPNAAPIKVEIAESWANVNYSGAWHVPHNHPTPWAANYYVKTQSEGKHLGAIWFINPVHVSKNIWQRQQIRIEPEEGEIIIFPGAFMHYVEPNLSEERRIGVAFNFRVNTAKTPWLLQT
jgi:uncharacterized protein (TIGR02466 family)